MCYRGFSILESSTHMEKCTAMSRVSCLAGWKPALIVEGSAYFRHMSTVATIARPSSTPDMMKRTISNTRHPKKTDAHFGKLKKTTYTTKWCLNPAEYNEAHMRAEHKLWTRLYEVSQEKITIIWRGLCARANETQRQEAGLRELFRS
jgi:hypothetical protein